MGADLERLLLWVQVVEVGADGSSEVGLYLDWRELDEEIIVAAGGDQALLRKNAIGP